MNCLALPFVCGLFTVVVKCSAPKMAHIVAKSFLTNRVALFVGFVCLDAVGV